MDTDWHRYDDDRRGNEDASRRRDEDFRRDMFNNEEHFRRRAQDSLNGSSWQRASNGNAEPEFDPTRHKLVMRIVLTMIVVGWAIIIFAMSR